MSHFNIQTHFYFSFTKKAKAYFHLPYRQTEGIVKAHSESKLPSIPDYSTISRRINRLDIKIDEYKQKGKDDYIIIVAIDSTGIKITKGNG